MAVVHFVQHQAEGREHLHRRVFLAKINPLETMDDDKLIADYRFPRHSILKITELCAPFLQRRTNRNHALPVQLQVLAALRFYAKGVFQLDLQGLTEISQSKLSRVIQDVSLAIVRHAPTFIRFPTTDDEILRTKQAFHAKAGFPNVLGAVDGTLINIQAPSGPIWIDKTGGCMMYRPNRACRIIGAIAVLHNLRLELNLPEYLEGKSITLCIYLWKGYLGVNITSLINVH
ncbi:putative nuclease HARBI1 [Folsomia candida]|uniref:putative nuclease HARBI1 n=1 Tax=Folsomia candida TaxID=158441 RepID=UPI001604D8C0|nr:putative nuclease HARBI1 [Folsomia candida]